MGPIGCPETSVRNYESTWRKIPQKSARLALLQVFVKIAPKTAQNCEKNKIKILHVIWLGFCKDSEGGSVTTVGRCIAIPLINNSVNGPTFSNVFRIQQLKLAALVSILLK